MLSALRNEARQQLADELLFEIPESEYYRAFNQLFPTRNRRGSSIVPPEDLAHKIRIFFDMDDPDLEILIDDLLDDHDIKKFVETYKEYRIIRAEEWDDFDTDPDDWDDYVLE